MTFFKMSIVIIFWLFASIANSAPNQSSQINFLVLTDLHFNPYAACEHISMRTCPLITKLRKAPVNEWQQLLAAYDTEAPRYRRNTNQVLLTSTLREASLAAKKQDVQFVLVLGDFIAHRFRHEYKRYSQDKSRVGYEAFVSKTLKYLSLQIGQAFPATDVYMVVGNNDSYRRDYYTQPNGLFFNDMASQWSQLIKTPENRNEMRQSFPLGGYYAVNLPNDPRVRLIALNTVMFSNKALGDHVDVAAKRQLDWLHEELAQAKQQKQRVFIAMHIPEGIDVYTSMRIRLIRVLELWMPEFGTRFQADVKAYAPQIAGMFAGHLHANWFHSLRFENLAEVPFVGTAAVSPVYGNDPGFRIFHYSADKVELKDFITYYFPISGDNTWREAQINPEQKATAA